MGLAARAIPTTGGDDSEWDGRVACTCVESGGDVAILKPDDIRHVDAFTSRYGIPAYGPLLYWRHDVPAADLRPIRRGSELPGGLRCLWDGRGQLETPAWLPEQRTIVFADGTAPEGSEPVHDRAAFERALDLPPWGANWPDDG